MFPLSDLVVQVQTVVICLVVGTCQRMETDFWRTCHSYKQFTNFTQNSQISVQSPRHYQYVFGDTLSVAQSLYCWLKCLHRKVLFHFSLLRKVCFVHTTITFHFSTFGQILLRQIDSAIKKKYCHHPELTCWSHNSLNQSLCKKIILPDLTLPKPTYNFKYTWLTRSSTFPSVSAWSSMMLASKPKFWISCAISRGCMNSGLYFTSALPAISATNTETIPAVAIIKNIR